MPNKFQALTYSFLTASFSFALSSYALSNDAFAQAGSYSCNTLGMRRLSSAAVSSQRSCNKYTALVQKSQSQIDAIDEKLPTASPREKIRLTVLRRVAVSNFSKNTRYQARYCANAETNLARYNENTAFCAAHFPSIPPSECLSGSARKEYTSGVEFTCVKILAEITPDGCFQYIEHYFDRPRLFQSQLNYYGRSKTAEVIYSGQSQDLYQFNVKKKIACPIAPSNSRRRR